MRGDVLYPASIDWLAILPILLVTGGGVLGMIIEMVRPCQTNNAIVVVSLTSLFPLCSQHHRETGHTTHKKVK
ncbi:MAG: hypothetical protein K6T17_06655, partial [Fimbriimonadales bacterium]|nr:hypothetical protein [Fimbriimonadales bacterium]